MMLGEWRVGLSKCYLISLYAHVAWYYIFEVNDNLCWWNVVFVEARFPLKLYNLWVGANCNALLSDDWCRQLIRYALCISWLFPRYSRIPDYKGWSNDVISFHIKLRNFWIIYLLNIVANAGANNYLTTLGPPKNHGNFDDLKVSYDHHHGHE